jgi:hypothetical protein
VKKVWKLNHRNPTADNVDHPHRAAARSTPSKTHTKLLTQDDITRHPTTPETTEHAGQRQIATPDGIV